MTETHTSWQNRQEERQVDDAELVRAAQRDLQRFDRLYAAYVQPVYRYLYSRVGGPAEAEELTSQTFLAALEKFPHYRHDGHFAAWLFSIARHKAADHFRAQSRLGDLEDADDLPLDLDLLEQAAQGERRAAIRRLVAGLPEDERELIRLRYLAELSFAQIARLLGRREDAVKKNLYRLLARLQSQLEDLHD